MDSWAFCQRPDDRLAGPQTGATRHRLANSYVDNSAGHDGELQLDPQGNKVGTMHSLRSSGTALDVLHKGGFT